jgi:long-chain acyl-CoA synthetase
MRIWNRLKELAASQGEKTALACGEETLSYAQFKERTEKTARGWLRRGLQPGDRVALHLRNGNEMAACYYACFAAGFVAVPINNRLTAEETGYVLEHSGARAYVTQPELRIPTSVPLWESGAGDDLFEGDLPVTDDDAPALLL